MALLAITDLSLVAWWLSATTRAKNSVYLLCHYWVADVPRETLRLPRVQSSLNVLSDSDAEWDWWEVVVDGPRIWWRCGGVRSRCHITPERSVLTCPPMPLSAHKTPPVARVAEQGTVADGEVIRATHSCRRHSAVPCAGWPSRGGPQQWRRRR